MLEAVLIAAIVVGVLTCPVMTWLGRRGIGPSWMTGSCEPANEDVDKLDDLREREQELASRSTGFERQPRVEAAPRD